MRHGTAKLSYTDNSIGAYNSKTIRKRVKYFTQLVYNSLHETSQKSSAAHLSFKASAAAGGHLYAKSFMDLLNIEEVSPNFNHLITHSLTQSTYLTEP